MSEEKGKLGLDLSRFEDGFKTETRERILTLNQGLLKLEKNPGEKELLQTLMREAHSIKGTAKMMQYESISTIAHRMEDGFAKALNEKMRMEKRHFDVLFMCLDAMEPLLEHKVEGEEKGIEDLCDKVGCLFHGEGRGPKTVEEKPRAGEQKTRIEEQKPVEKKETQKKEPLRPSANAAASGSIRVGIEKLNKLMNLSGELLVSKIRLNELVRNIIGETESAKETGSELGGLTRELKKVSESIDSLTSHIQNEVMKLRMVPISYLFNTYPRAMRDLAAEKKKDVELEIKGEDTQLDKSIIDEMKDPLMHILRNSVDHGIEEPAERLEKGKPKTGRILLNAFQKGSQVIIEVSDDGRGIDIDGVKRQAVKQGLVPKEKIDGMADEHIFQLLFIPGFSTKETVTDVSGRGVGLDVVRDKVAKCKGMLEVASLAGSGTKITLKLPLTLAITESLLVASGNDVFAIPIDTIVETVRLDPKAIKTVETREVITVRGQILPLVRIHELFGLPARGIIERKFFPVVIVQSVERKMGFLVDKLLGRQEIVSKPIGSPLQKVENIAGATILGDGRVVLILDVSSIVESTEGVGIRRAAMEPKPGRIKKRIKTILLVEDVLTTAMLEKNILESAGYSVVLARDGKEALEKTSQERFDLVITDILMPGMNGFEVTERLKKDKSYKDVPVVIVTGKENDEDRRRGMNAGAEAYMLKSEFTSEGLLDTIERLIG